MVFFVGHVQEIKDLCSMVRASAEARFRIGFVRSDLRRRLTAEPARVLDNFLQKKKKSGALNPEQKSSGTYRFRNRLLALYLRLESQRPRRATRSRVASSE